MNGSEWITQKSSRSVRKQEILHYGVMGRSLLRDEARIYNIMTKTIDGVDPGHGIMKSFIAILPRIYPQL